MTGSPPTRIGRYEIESELGRGMMGVVYRAHDPALGRAVALKTVSLAFSVTDPAEREGFEKRFLVEARSAAGLSHPGIIVVHDVGRDPETGVLYIALEYLKGRTLAELTSDGRALPLQEALRLMVRVAEALHHAHTHGVVHRDVKPANIMVLESGQPKIMDFGIAKVESAGLTMAGQFFGTPRYMSPEQALGQPVDARTDVFALGAVLYSLLTGRAAFDAKEVPMIFTQVARHDPPPPSQVVPSIPVDVDYVVARSLAKAPADRYPTAQAFGEDLEDLLAGRPPRHRPSWNAPTTPTGTVVSTLQAIQGGAAPVLGGHGTFTEPAIPAPKRETSSVSAPAPGLARRAATASPAPATTGVQRSASVRPPRDAKPVGPSAVRPGLWALALLVVVGLGAFALLQLRGHGPSDVPVAPPSTAVAGTAVLPDTLTRLPDPGPDAPSAAPVPPATPSLQSTRETAAPARKPRAAASPTRSATASPKPEAAPPSAPTSATRAQLRIDFEHPLKSGIVRLWLDGALLIEEDLEGRVTRNVAGLKLRKGGFEKEVDLEPGKHTVRVQVKWEDYDKVEALTGTFDPGESRVLEIRVGRLRKNLSAEWR